MNTTDTTYPSPRLPKGWTLHDLCGAPAAADTEGLVHVNIDGSWMLYVPWFRGNRDEFAVLKHINGHEVEARINDKNTITTPAGRKVGSRKWYH